MGCEIVVGRDQIQFDMSIMGDLVPCNIKGVFIHYTGATFVPVQVHSSFLLWLCIHLFDTNTKSHAGASHTGMKLIAPVRVFTCKHPRSLI